MLILMLAPKMVTAVSEHRVVNTYEGCVSDEDVSNSLFEGEYDECVEFLREMTTDTWNKLVANGYEFNIVNMQSGRVCCFKL